MIFRNILFFIVFFLSACNQIKTGDKLGNADIVRIKKLHLLDEDETIFKFYSEFKNKLAGNFFTNKRLATYWIDEKNESRSRIRFAFYPEIKSIDTVLLRRFNLFALFSGNKKRQYKI